MLLYVSTCRCNATNFWGCLFCEQHEILAWSTKELRVLLLARLLDVMPVLFGEFVGLEIVRGRNVYINPIAPPCVRMQIENGCVVL